MNKLAIRVLEWVDERFETFLVIAFVLLGGALVLCVIGLVFSLLGIAWVLS